MATQDEEITSRLVKAIRARQRMTSPTADATLDLIREIRRDQSAVLRLAGMPPDPWQARAMRSQAPQILMLCSRQSGKSQTAAAIALAAALEGRTETIIKDPVYPVRDTVSRTGHDREEIGGGCPGVHPSAALSQKLGTISDNADVKLGKIAGKAGQKSSGRVRSVEVPFRPALVLILSRALRQSGEFFRAKLLPMYRKLGSPYGLRKLTALECELGNGSRIMSLPGETADTLVGFSDVSCLVIDEAARVSDHVYTLMRPVLAVSRGRLVCLSTPYGKRGWFWSAYTQNGTVDPAKAHRLDDGWERFSVTAPDCPRITAEFLAREKAEFGERYFRQEYLCSFEDVVDAAFDGEAVERACKSDLKPLW